MRLGSRFASRSTEGRSGVLPPRASRPGCAHPGRPRSGRTRPRAESDAWRRPPGLPSPCGRSRRSARSRPGQHRVHVYGNVRADAVAGDFGAARVGVVLQRLGCGVPWHMQRPSRAAPGAPSSGAQQRFESFAGLYRGAARHLHHLQLCTGACAVRQLLADGLERADDLDFAHHVVGDRLHGAIPIPIPPERPRGQHFVLESVVGQHVPIEVAHAVDVVEQGLPRGLPNLLVVVAVGHPDVREGCDGHRVGGASGGGGRFTPVATSS